MVTGRWNAALWELPFRRGHGDRYLIENAAVSYAPSLTALRGTSSAKTTRNGFVGIRQSGFRFPETVERASIAKRDEKLTPLPEAETEVKALAQLHGSTSRVFIGTEASEARLKSKPPAQAFLHFATHGILNDAAPLYSHLALAAGDKAEDGQKEDGLLEAWELLQMNLNADLACFQTRRAARGKIGAVIQHTRFDGRFHAQPERLWLQNRRDKIRILAPVGS
ncbi:MAG: CHAT domain-containing protein [Acidobacteriota bacterium]